MEFFFSGVEDLKGHILKRRGSKTKKTGESAILMGLFILVRQAEHEIKNGNPSVHYNNISCVIHQYSFLCELKLCKLKFIPVRYLITCFNSKTFLLQVALAYLEKGIKIRPDFTELLALRCKCFVELHRFR